MADPASLRRFAAVACLAFTACHDRAEPTVDVAAMSLSPAPGATAVSRRAAIRAVLDRDLDPATLAGARLTTGDGVPVAAAVDYDSSARLVTLVPAAPLARATAYRVELANSLRTVRGERFARAIEWTFATDAADVWDRADEVAAGRLVAVRPSRRGGVLAVWAVAGDALVVARGDAAGWSAPVPLGAAGLMADVADDATGRVVVAFLSLQGAVLVAVAESGQAFAAAETVAPFGAAVHVDASDSGHVAVSWDDSAGLTSMRSRVPGVGWASPFSVFLPNAGHVRLTGPGEGVAVCSFASPGPAVGGRRFAVDALGNWSLLDPLPLPQGFGFGADVGVDFRDDRILVAQPVLGLPLPVATTAALAWSPGAGWQVLPPQLPRVQAAVDGALGPAGAVLLASVQAGGRPVAWLRTDAGVDEQVFGGIDQPAPAEPALGAVVTPDGIAHVLWTAAVAAGPAAAVRLLASSRPQGGVWGEPVVVDGPVAAGEPFRGLRVVDDGGSACAVWQRGGVVRSSTLR